MFIVMKSSSRVFGQQWGSVAQMYKLYQALAAQKTLDGMINSGFGLFLWHLLTIGKGFAFSKHKTLKQCQNH